MKVKKKKERDDIEEYVCCHYFSLNSENEVRGLGLELCSLIN